MRPTTAALSEAPVESRSKPEARVEALVVEHFDFIWRLLRRWGLSRADADDAAQDVFITVAAKIERVSPGSERTYLYGTALRIAANAKRKSRRRREGDEAPSHHLPEAAGEDWALRMETQDLLARLLDTLDDDLRRVLVLAASEGLELSEIAALERIPIGTAASRLRRARERFRKELERLESVNPFRKDES
jgi:RNA polymerase sigma-70 factor (ECF subfamily)